jgi:hypothetical protein
LAEVGYVRNRRGVAVQCVDSRFSCFLGNFGDFNWFRFLGLLDLLDSLVGFAGDIAQFPKMKLVDVFGADVAISLGFVAVGNSLVKLACDVVGMHQSLCSNTFLAS